MARKEITIDIQDREQNLTFKIKEMPATRLEEWIIKALLILGESLGDQDFDLNKAGSFLYQNGLKGLARLDYAKAKPLLEDLLLCCSRVVGKVEERCSSDTVDTYILDVKTLFLLRIEALKLNLDFLLLEIEGRSSSREKEDIKEP